MKSICSGKAFHIFQHNNFKKKYCGISDTCINVLDLNEMLTRSTQKAKQDKRKPWVSSLPANGAPKNIQKAKTRSRG